MRRREPGSPDNPLPANTDVPEPKVKASSGGGGTGAAVGALVAWLLSTYVFDGDLPVPVEAAVYVLVPAVLAAVGAYWAGFRARHQYRYRPPA